LHAGAGAFPLLGFWILGADEEVEDVVVARTKVLDYGDGLGFVEAFWFGVVSRGFGGLY